MTVVEDGCCAICADISISKDWPILGVCHHTGIKGIYNSTLSQSFSGYTDQQHKGRNSRLMEPGDSSESYTGYHDGKDRMLSRGPASYVKAAASMCVNKELDKNTAQLRKFQVDFYQTDHEGDNCLHRALIIKDSHSAMDIIAEAPSASELNIQNRLGQTALHLAAIQNLAGVVRMLVIWGARVDMRDSMGNTPLHKACEHGLMDCVLALTTPPNHEEWVTCPYLRTFQMIPQDQSIMNYSGLTCLHVAGKAGYYDVIKHVIRNCGANVNTKDGTAGHTVLMQAVINSDVGLVQFLLSHFRRMLDVNVQRYDGCSALDLCCNMDIYRLLEGAGAVSLKPEDDSVDLMAAAAHAEEQVQELTSDLQHVALHDLNSISR